MNYGNLYNMAWTRHAEVSGDLGVKSAAGVRFRRRGFGVTSGTFGALGACGAAGSVGHVRGERASRSAVSVG